jgi:hypothetical protein
LNLKRIICFSHVLHAGFSPGDVHLIQYCRLYLQAHTVSDITDSTGTRLKVGARSGTLFSCSSTRYIPTIQARPNARAWRIWRSALALWATEEDRLTVPLGEWLVLPEAQRFRWQWYTHGVSLYSPHGPQYRRFPPIRTRRKYRDYLCPKGSLRRRKSPCLLPPARSSLHPTSCVSDWAASAPHTSHP